MQSLQPYDDIIHRELLDGLKKLGFKLNMGEDGSGVIMLFLRRGGGFYFGRSINLSFTIDTES